MGKRTTSRILRKNSLDFLLKFFDASDVELKKILRPQNFDIKKTTRAILNNSFLTCQILNWKEYNPSKFKMKKTTRQILTSNSYNVSDFVLKKSQHIRFWIETSTTRQIVNSKNYIALDFEFKASLRIRSELKSFCLVRFWPLNCTCEIWN